MRKPAVAALDTNPEPSAPRPKDSKIHGLLKAYIGLANMPVKEPELIQRIRRAASSGHQKPARGIGDDCAVLTVPRGHEILVTTDFSLEGVHFRREWHPADSVGHRCLARGIGDDCAVLTVPRGHEILVTTDFSLEGVHFRREWHPADSVGHRCLAR